MRCLLEILVRAKLLLEELVGEIPTLLRKALGQSKKGLGLLSREKALLPLGFREPWSHQRGGGSLSEHFGSSSKSLLPRSL